MLKHAEPTKRRMTAFLLGVTRLFGVNPCRSDLVRAMLARAPPTTLWQRGTQPRGRGVVRSFELTYDRKELNEHPRTLFRFEHRSANTRLGATFTKPMATMTGYRWSVDHRIRVSGWRNIDGSYLIETQNGNGEMINSVQTPPHTSCLVLNTDYDYYDRPSLTVYATKRWRALPNPSRQYTPILCNRDVRCMIELELKD